MLIDLDGERHGDEVVMGIRLLYYEVDATEGSKHRGIYLGSRSPACDSSGNSEW
jgi:hypothetical protein